MKIVAVLSGGMDSTSVMGQAIARGDQVVGAISFWYGSKHNNREWCAAQDVAAHYGVPLKRVHLDVVAELFKSDLLASGGDIPEGHYADESMKKTVVPFRNGIMFAIAAGYAESLGAQGILTGCHFGDHAIYPDCRTSFLKAMGQAMEQGTYAGIQLISSSPWVTKTDLARQGAAVGVPFGLTYSCYNGREKHCGLCGTCVERKEAFRDAGLEDPTEYEA